MLREFFDCWRGNVPIASAPLTEFFSGNAGRPPGAKDLDPIIRAAGTHPAIADEAERLIRVHPTIDEFTNNATILRRGTAPERLAFYAISRLLFRDSDKKRRRLHRRLNGGRTPLDACAIDKQSGILIVRPPWRLVDDVVEEAEAGFAMSQAARGSNPGKTFMVPAQLPLAAMRSKAMALAQHPAVLRIVGDYLGGLPILLRINLLSSANDVLQDNSSQFFHIDPEDYRQVKIFILVNDVDEETGPLHLLRADASDKVRIARNHRHGRLSDDNVLSVAGADNLVPCVGEHGTMVFCDTSRCFHYGSRPGKRFRHVVMLHYVTAFAASFPIGAKSISTKYAQQAVDRAEETGAPLSDRARHLLGIER